MNNPIVKKMKITASMLKDTLRSRAYFDLHYAAANGLRGLGFNRIGDILNFLFPEDGEDSNFVLKKWHR